MAQVGVYSAALLMQHSHLNASMGGVLNAYSRYGAYRTPYRTGALVLHCDNNTIVANGGPPGYRLMKETRINTAQPGRYRIYWDMRNADNVTVVNTKFYVNGAAISAAQASGVSAWVNKTYNYDVNLAAGDLLQIWGDSTTDAVDVRDFRIYYDWGIAYFGDGTFNNLVTLLPLTDADLLDFTAII